MAIIKLILADALSVPVKDEFIAVSPSDIPENSICYLTAIQKLLSSYSVASEHELLDEYGLKIIGMDAVK